MPLCATPASNRAGRSAAHSSANCTARRAPAVRVVPLLLTLAASPLGAQKVDMIYLTNGDRVRGEIKKLEHGRIEYKTDDLGTVNVKWDKIDEVESPRFFEIESSAGVRRFGSLGRAGLVGFLVVRGASADTLPLSFIVRITPIKSNLWNRLDGYLNFGYSLTRADNQHEITLQGEVRYRGRDVGTRLDGSSYLRTRSGSRTTRNSYSLSVQRYLPKRWAAWAIGQVQQNEELQLDYRTLVGVGPARQLVLTNHMDFIAYAGGAVSREKYATADTGSVSGEALLGGRFSAFRHSFPKLDFSTELQIFPSLTESGRLRTELQLRLSYEILKDFTVGLSGFYTRDSHPPDPATPKDDYSLSTTVGWIF